MYSKTSRKSKINYNVLLTSSKLNLFIVSYFGTINYFDYFKFPQVQFKKNNDVLTLKEYIVQY